MTPTRPGPSPCEDAPSHGHVGLDPDDPMTLRLSGEVDFLVVHDAGPALHMALLSVRTVDASEVTFVDSAGVHCLVVAMKAAHHQSRDLRLVHPTPLLVRLLELRAPDLVGHLVITPRQDRRSRRTPS